jgi:hypothetical protein
MDYSVFQSLQLLLFFGSAIGFCLWQLALLRRLRRDRAGAGEERASQTSRPASRQRED